MRFCTCGDEEEEVLHDRLAAKKGRRRIWTVGVRLNQNPFPAFFVPRSALFILCTQLKFHFKAKAQPAPNIYPIGELVRWHNPKHNSQFSANSSAGKGQ